MSTRKPGEPIYLRRHIAALAVAVLLPIVLLQLFKLYVGQISFGIQIGIAVAIAALTGLTLYFTYRSSAQNQP
jgi:hypothetical protein